MTATDPDRSDTVNDQASAWVVRLDGASVSDADYEAFDAWLTQDPAHDEAFTTAEALWRALDDDRAALDAALTRSASAAPARPVAPLNLTRRRWTLGAGGLIAAGLLAAMYVPAALDKRPIVYVTAPGEQRIVALADGSRLIMNGGSRATVRFAKDERLVDMENAEIAFDVAHDASRPFRVSVGESRIEVLGTAFNVRRDGSVTRVAVARGLVSVTDAQDAERSVRLGAGQTVSRADADGRMRVGQAVVEIADWRSRRLVYEDRPLSDIAADLSRAYPTPVRAIGPAANLRFTGVLVLDDQATTIRRLEGFLPIVATRRNGVIELRRR